MSRQARSTTSSPLLEDQTWPSREQRCRTTLEQTNPLKNRFIHSFQDINSYILPRILTSFKISHTLFNVVQFFKNHSVLLEWFHHGFYGMRCVKAAILGQLFCPPALSWGGGEGCARLALPWGRDVPSLLNCRLIILEKELPTNHGQKLPRNARKLQI